jgi:hypothetical protein
MNKKILSALAILLVTLGFIAYSYGEDQKKQSITSFEECVSAGYPVMTSYPEQCRVPGGTTFVHQIDKSVTWISQTIEPINLSLSYPQELVFKEELAEDGISMRTVGFYLTKGDIQDPEYQLYALLSLYRDATLEDLEKIKTDMDQDTIEEVTIGSYHGIEGRVTGPKERWLTVILKENKLFTISTSPPTQENKTMTDEIIKTFEFGE